MLLGTCLHSCSWDIRVDWSTPSSPKEIVSILLLDGRPALCDLEVLGLLLLLLLGVGVLPRIELVVLGR